MADCRKFPAPTAEWFANRNDSKMNSKTLAGLVATTALLAAAGSASGQNWSDNFDSYTVGSIQGQGGWEGWTGNAAAAGTVTTAQSSSAPKSLQIVRGNDTVKTFSGVNSGVWTFSMQQYIPSSAAGKSWVILMNQYPSNLDWSEQLEVDITGGSVKSDNGFASASVPLVKDAWITLRFDIDLTAGSVSSFYNTTLMSTHDWHDATGINALRALDLYADEDVAGGTAQVGSVYYDNFTLVPEPTSASLLLLGGLALLLRPRKQA